MRTIRFGPGGIPPRRGPLIAAAAMTIAAVSLLFIPLSNDYRALWYGAAMDWLHLPFFAAFCLVARLLLSGRRPAAIAAAVLLATLAEVLQPLVGRTPSVVDWINGILGVASAACWMYGARSRMVRWGGVVVCASWPTLVAVPSWWDAGQAWYTFPVLSDFRSPRELHRWQLEGAQIVPKNSGGATIRFKPSKQGSGIVLLPVVRDWNLYRQLVCTFEFAGEPLDLLISVRDGKKLPPELPRFDLLRHYLPGKHRVVVPLDELRRGGPFPPIDLKQVQSFHLVVYDPQPRTLDFQSAYLVR